MDTTADLLFEPVPFMFSECNSAKSCYPLACKDTTLYVNIVNAGNEVLEIKQGTLLGQLSEI